MSVNTNDQKIKYLKMVFNSIDEYITYITDQQISKEYIHYMDINNENGLVTAIFITYTYAQFKRLDD